MPRKITPATSLDTLRKEAERWLKDIRANDAEARARFAAAYATGPATPTLRDVQHALAREHGHESWVALKKAVEQPDVERSTPIALAQTPEEYDRLAGDLVLAFDAQDDSIAPRRTLSDREWDSLIAFMKERRITSLNAIGLMTDAVLSRVADLDHVTSLTLGGSRALTDAGLRHLARMPQLTQLNLSEYPGGNLTDRGLEVLRHLPNLRVFEMTWQRGITDAGVANLKFCEHLERVDLMGSPTGDASTWTVCRV